MPGSQRRRAQSRAHEVVPFPDEERSNRPHCEQVQAMDRNTAAIDRLAAEVTRAREDFKAIIGEVVKELKPAADSLEKLGGAQEKLCNFIVNNRLKLAGGVIGALLAVGAISPSAADALRAVLAGFGASS